MPLAGRRSGAARADTLGGTSKPGDRLLGALAGPGRVPRNTARGSMATGTLVPRTTALTTRRDNPVASALTAAPTSHVGMVAGALAPTSYRVVQRDTRRAPVAHCEPTIGALPMAGTPRRGTDVVAAGRRHVSPPPRVGECAPVRGPARSATPESRRVRESQMGLGSLHPTPPPLRARTPPPPLPHRRHIPIRRFIDSPCRRDHDALLTMQFDAAKVDPLDRYRAPRARAPPPQASSVARDRDTLALQHHRPRLGPRDSIAVVADLAVPPPVDGRLTSGKSRCCTPPRRAESLLAHTTAPSPARQATPVRQASPMRGRSNVCSQRNILAWV